MKELFHIGAIDSVPEQAELSLFVTRQEMAFAITTGTGKNLHGLRYAQIEDWNEKELAAFVEAYPVLERPFTRTHLAVATAQLALRPGPVTDKQEAAAFLATLGFACTADGAHQDYLPTFDSTLLYAIEPTVAEWFAHHFSGIRYRYLYTPFLTGHTAPENELIRVDFRTTDFTVLITKGNRLLVLQQHEYETPADVLFHLLSYVRYLGLSQQETPVELSGLIERDSSLYQELYQYFIRLWFHEAGWSNEPAHFFSNLNALASCVS